MADKKKCDVVGCDNEAVKTVARKKAEAVLDLGGKGTKVHLCKEHYKEYKKKTKKERKLERVGWV
ncbi:MAG: hypothetical protein GXO25_07570 [Euryarchaeota archaeon]|nr:hypothetical protein [Euryarchaeota archaeon]